MQKPPPPPIPTPILLFLVVVFLVCFGVPIASCAINYHAPAYHCRTVHYDTGAGERFACID